ncbi:MAG: hypothetical protein Q4C42_06225 [Clostridia bacterium]|nr:hypothetical protein [Clostridia bacterium]
MPTEKIRGKKSAAADSASGRGRTGTRSSVERRTKSGSGTRSSSGRTQAQKPTAKRAGTAKRSTESRNVSARTKSSDTSRKTSVKRKSTNPPQRKKTDTARQSRSTRRQKAEFRFTPQVFAVIAVAVLAMFAVSRFVGRTVYKEVPAYTVSTQSVGERFKLVSGSEFNPDCITDEIDILFDEEYLKVGLAEFFEITGVQPYVYFKKYDVTLADDASREIFAREYYDANIHNTNGFLFMCFADANGEPGFMTYADGIHADNVMDENAASILWEYIDHYNDGNLVFEEVLTDSFIGTANTIFGLPQKTVLESHTNGSSKLRFLLIGVIALISVIIVINTGTVKPKKKSRTR